MSRPLRERLEFYHLKNHLRGDVTQPPLPEEGTPESIVAEGAIASTDLQLQVAGAVPIAELGDFIKDTLKAKKEDGITIKEKLEAAKLAIQLAREVTKLEIAKLAKAPKGSIQPAGSMKRLPPNQVKSTFGPVEKPKAIAPPPILPAPFIPGRTSEAKVPTVAPAADAPSSRPEAQAS